jgi:hypothetical protein
MFKSNDYILLVLIGVYIFKNSCVEHYKHKTKCDEISRNIRKEWDKDVIHALCKTGKHHNCDLDCNLDQKDKVFRDILAILVLLIITYVLFNKT